MNEQHAGLVGALAARSAKPGPEDLG